MQFRIVAIILLLGAAPAWAQDAQAGHDIATKWCANCHVVEVKGPAVRNDAVPSFRAIAQMNSTTAASLAAFLATPHPRMPNYTLSRQEIRDVSAYILSLRDAKTDLTSR